MLYELRIYEAHRGRLADVVNRFKDNTLRIFPENGIHVTQFWVDAEGLEKLYYICAFADIAAKEKAWESFRLDENWLRVKAESEKNGPIVAKIESYMMKEADFFTP